MRENFDRAVNNWLLRPDIEGKFSDDPDDPGGLTKWGIAERYHPEVRNPNFSKEDAIAIYLKKYWNKCRCDDLPDGVDVLVFDMAVNPGPIQAIKFLQEALDVKVDGVIGNDTLNALRRKGDGLKNGFIKDTLSHRIKYYVKRCVENPVKVKYIRGWVLRSFKLYEYIGRM